QDEARRTPDVEQQRRRARRLALSLLELGETDEQVEQQLHRWKIHPALAHDALRWAHDRRRHAAAGATLPGRPGRAAGPRITPITGEGGAVAAADAAAAAATGSTVPPAALIRSSGAPPLRA